MSPMINVPYTYNVYNPQLTTICITDFFSAGLLWGITNVTATLEQDPTDPTQQYIDIEILIMSGANNNPYDSVNVDVTPFMSQRPSYGQITITNPDGTKSTTKVHLESNDLTNKLS
jgi:hypothetical protein